MSENQNGRLYSANGVKHPGATPVPVGTKAVPNPPAAVPPGQRHGPKAEIVEALPGQVFGVVAFFTVAAGVGEALVRGEMGLFTNVAFALISLFAAGRVGRQYAWAGWTSPPIAFAILALIYANLFNPLSDTVAKSSLLGLVVILSEHMWAVLGTSAACFVLVQLRHGRLRRRKG